MVVDRLFAAAELRLGGETQKKVRIVRTDGRPRGERRFLKSAARAPRRSAPAPATAAGDTAFPQAPHRALQRCHMAVLGAVLWALDGRRSKQETGSELYDPEHKTTADELAKLPRDYGGLPPGVPPLGPPLPGDLRTPDATGAGAARRHRSGAAARRAGDRVGAHERLFTSSSTVNRAAPSPASAPPMQTGAFEIAGDRPPMDPELDPEHAGSQTRVPQWTDR